MTVSTIVNVRVRLADLLFGDAKALHVGNMGAIGFAEGAFISPLKKRICSNVLHFCKSPLRSLCVIPQVQVILQHIIAEFL